MKIKTILNETGYDAWLNYTKLEHSKATLYSYCKSICTNMSDPLLKTAGLELAAALKYLLGNTPQLLEKPDRNGSILLMSIDNCPLEAEMYLSKEEKKVLGKESYLIRHSSSGPGKHLIIASGSGSGVLYGVFSFLRLLQSDQFKETTHIIESPAVSLRMLNQWDNMDGSVERGYAGRSIFFNNGQFLQDLGRIRDYARLMASVGLNGIVINNVNVHKLETKLITDEFLPQVANIAGIFREYGIKTYLSINYSSPMELGGIKTADPLDEEVQLWWKSKADEIYRYIPDLGGFLVKADSEFRPGPFTYGRNHAEGSNMLAAALKPHGGVVIWRCFVYNCMQDWRDRVTDRANAAYDNFMPLDGKFADNVLLQIKNGPMDFQVREPVSPLFGGLSKSNFILECQITQEYTGQQKHLCYLAPMWNDILDFDTWSKGKNTTVKRLLSDAKNEGGLSGITAVSNIGNDLNWTGHDLAQANLYSFGRLAWNPDLASGDIALEWIRQTYGTDPVVLKNVYEMLMESYNIYESYTSPLGIGWMVNPGHHYGPSVDGYEYSAWGTYHRADCNGIGVDRTVATGTGYAGRYFPPNSELFEKPESCPEELLLFFHHIPYQYRLKSGVTLIQYIYDTHFDGADKAGRLVEKWESLQEHIESNCYERVLKRLQNQALHACEWRDVINSYFLRKSGIPDEKGRMIY